MKRILVFTGCSADWGLLEPIVNGLVQEARVQVEVVALSRDHARFAQEQTKCTVHTLNVDLQRWESNLRVLFEQTTVRFNQWLVAKRYTDLIVLGDRAETLAAVTIAFTAGIAVHHLFAGDKSGCLDDSYRSAISTLSTFLYSFSHEAWRRSMVLSKITSQPRQAIRCKPYASLDQSILKQPPFNRPFALIRFHPETRHEEDMASAINQTVGKALEKGLVVVAFPPNTDDGSSVIMRTWNRLRKVYGENIHWMDTPITRAQYLALLKEASYVAGNSSSFVLEAPLVDQANVDLVGCRQLGRTPLVLNDPEGSPVLQQLKDYIYGAYSKPRIE